MDVSGNVEFAHLFVKRVPETIAQWRRFHTGAFSGIGIQQKSDKALLFDTPLQIGQHRRRTDARSQRQSANPAKDFREELYFLSNDVVRFFSEPLHQFRAFTGHHLIGTGRDHLHIGPGLFQLLQVR